MGGRPESPHRRALLVNASILALATVLLVATPATVSFPIKPTEAVVMVFGLVALLVLNALALRIGSDRENARPPTEARPRASTAAPAEAAECGWLAADDHQQAEWLRVCEHFLVDTAASALGVVDEVEVDDEGRAIALLVVTGWSGRGCVRVPADAIVAASPSARQLVVDEARVERL